MCTLITEACFWCWCSANGTINWVKNFCVLFIPFLLIGPEILFVCRNCFCGDGPISDCQFASLYANSVMNWCCDCQPCLTLTVHNLHQTLYTVICQPCLTLTVHNLHLTLYTVMNWCWDCPPCLTLTVYRLSFRFVGRPGKYKTIFGARQEEVSVLLFFGCFSFGDHLFC